MILSTVKTRIIGMVYDNDCYTIPDNSVHTNPYKVIREATFEEWVQDVLSKNSRESPASLEYFRNDGCFYYEISVD